MGQGSDGVITFQKEVIVNRTFEMTAEEFVKIHLMEVRQFGSELDLLVQSGTNSGFITSAITLKDSELIDFGGSYLDFDRSARDEARTRHNSASKALVDSLELKFSKRDS